MGFQVSNHSIHIGKMLIMRSRSRELTSYQ